MEFKHPKDEYNSDDIELKTPRRSIRLRSNTTTPATNKSTVKKMFSERRSAKLSKTKLDMPKSDFSTKKVKSRRNSESSMEEKHDNLEEKHENLEEKHENLEEKHENMEKKHKNSSKGKRRKGKKSRKDRNKAKGIQSINIDSDNNMLNVTFDKLSSSNSEAEYIEKDKDGNTNLSSSSWVQEASSSNDVPFKIPECKQSGNSSTILSTNNSRDSPQDPSHEENISSTDSKEVVQDEKQALVKKDEEVEEVVSSSEECVNLQGPLANGYVLQKDLKENTEAKIDSNISFNFSGIKTLSDTDTTSNNPSSLSNVKDDTEAKKDSNVSFNSSGIKPLSDTDTTSNIPSIPSSEEKNVSQSPARSNLHEESKEQDNSGTINKSINLDHCRDNDMLLPMKSPKTPVLEKKVEKLVSSTPIMRPISTTAAPKSVKRLKSESLKHSSSKNTPKKSVANRVSTPFHKQGNSEKKVDPLKLLNASVAQELLVSPIITPLRSIRKRSLSVSVQGKKSHRVTFHSPSNIEIPIGDIDEVMKKPISKEPKPQETEIYVTLRRKRSLSVAETESEKKLAFVSMDLLEDNEGTPSKLKKLPVPTSRTKMPNFAAIHQQKFQKMESIADHVARKAERAKALASSTTKTGSSVQKTEIKSDVKKHTESKALTATSKITNKSRSVPKARQKIDLSHVEDKKVQNEKAINPIESAMDKIKSRQKKNIELYKSRPQSNQKDQQSKRQEIVKGVRSNRRFELQMMCRNRVDQ